jgi:hypothetical protein
MDCDEHLGRFSLILAVPIKDQVARCAVFRKSLAQLLHDPRARGMFGGIEVEDPSPAMAYYEESLEHPKSRGRHREEIHGRHHLSMVLQKNQPALSGISSAAQPSKVAGHRPLRNSKPSFNSSPWILGASQLGFSLTMR